MLALTVAALIRGDAPLAAALTGGVYPAQAGDPSWLDPRSYPAAFDRFGELLPTALVRDGAAFLDGFPTAHMAQAIVEVLLWQARGRGTIEPVAAQIRRLLDGSRADTPEAYVYRLTYAGQSTPQPDAALADAEHTLIRWQSAIVLK